MRAVSATDLVFSWEPGVRAQLMRIHHLLPGQSAALSPAARLGGYPVVQVPNGTVVGDDARSRFLAVLDGFLHARGHMDVSSSLGVPATQESIVFTGVGGLGAVRGIMAWDPVSGSVGWLYAPDGIRPDPILMKPTVLPETIETVGSPIPGLQVGGQNAAIPGGIPNAPGSAGSVLGFPGASLPQGGSGAAGAGKTAGSLRPGVRSARPPNGQASPVPAREPGPLFAARRRPTTPARIPPAPETHTVQVPRGVLEPTSTLPHGHWSNAGLVLLKGRVYGEVNHSVAALDQKTGQEIWRYPLHPRGVVRSLVATPEHLVFCLSIAPNGERLPVWASGAERGEHMLVALRAEDGKREWIHPVDHPGNLALAGGLLFFTDGRLHVFGPAERTFELAVDSSRREDYRSSLNEGEPGRPETATDGSLASATTLRLKWGEALPEMLRKGRERRARARQAPLLLSLDWLDETRSTVFGAAGPGGLPREDEFAATAGALAAALHPEHIDLAPEVNVYLARYPDRVPAVRSLLRIARAAVHRASTGTQVLASLNVEVLRGLYGIGKHLPFGELPSRGDPRLTRGERAQALSLIGEMDELGLTSSPQSAFGTADAMPPDYLYALKAVAGEKKVLLTGVRLQPGRTALEKSSEADFLERLVANCYWLESPIVSYPDAAAAREAPGTESARTAVSVWREVLSWKRVQQLSLGQPAAVAPVAER